MSGPLWKQLGVLGQSRKATALTYEQKLLAGLTGIVAYWPLTPDKWSDGANGVLDVSGNGYHATSTNATKDQADGPSTAMGRAGYWNGTNARVASSAVPRNTAGTLFVWAKMTALSGAFRTIALTMRAYIQRRTNGDNVYSAVYSANANSGNVATAGAGSWACYTVRWKTNDVKAQVDSTSVWTLTSWTPSAVGSNIVGIGADDNVPNSPFIGNIMHCGILDHYATAEEMALILSST